MYRLDKPLRDQCVALGLDLDEMEELFARSDSVGPVLARLVEAEIAADKAADEAAAAARADAEARGLPVGVGSRRWRRTTGSSFSLSVRLDHDEIDELRRRATEQGIGVSVLARTYIRSALLSPPRSRLRR